MMSTSGSDGSSKKPAPVPARSIDGLTPVAVAEIDDALHARRLQLLAKMERPRAHSCVMTLIISVEDEHDNRHVFRTVEQLAGKYPIRVIGVQAAASRESDDLFAWINAACEGEPAAPICSEEIALQGGVEAVDRIVSAVRGLLVPDLPVFLWWRGSTPHGHPLWQGLRPLCDRIVVDSIRFGDGAAALDTLRRLVSAHGSRMSVRDLNWERTAPWRAAVATCFDDRTALAQLPAIDRASISYAAQATRELPSARSMLLAGWLQSRYQRLRGHIRTAAAESWPAEDAGRIVAIALTSSQSKASLMLVRTTEPLGIEAQARGSDGKAFRRWRFAAHTLSEAQLLDCCLETLGADPIFEAALEG